MRHFRPFSYRPKTWRRIALIVLFSLPVLGSLAPLTRASLLRPDILTVSGQLSKNLNTAIDAVKGAQTPALANAIFVLNVRKQQAQLLLNDLKKEEDSGNLTPDELKKITDAYDNLKGIIDKADPQLNDKANTVAQQLIDDLTTAISQAAEDTKVSGISPADYRNHVAHVLATSQTLSAKIAMSQALLSLVTDKDKLAALQTAISNANASLGQLKVLTRGDHSRDISQTVPLYFYQDSEAMLRELVGDDRPVSRVNSADYEAARVAVETARGASTQATQSLADAQGERLAANDAVTRLTAEEGELRTRLDDATKHLSKSAAALEKAIKGQQAVANGTPEAQALAQKTYDAAKATNDGDVTEQTNARTALEGNAESQDSARSRLRDAENRLETAGKVLLSANTAMNQREIEFADAKAALNALSAPLVAPAIPDSTDALDRVRITASSGGLLTLRGTPEDVKTVAEIVGNRDRPGAQVRATFWTIQINGSASDSDVRKMQNSVRDINDEMMLARGQIALSGATLRDAILRRYQWFIRKPGVEISRDAPYGFFEDDVTRLLRLGKDIDSDEYRGLTPLSMSTYAEAVAVLSLAKREHRNAIIADFLQELPKRLTELEVEYRSQRGKRTSPKEREQMQQQFVSSAQFLRLQNYFHYELKDQLGYPDGNQHLVALDGEPFQTPEQNQIMQFWAGIKPGFWLKIDRTLLLLEAARQGQLDNTDDETLKKRASVNQMLGREPDDHSAFDNGQLDLLISRYRQLASDLKLQGLGPDMDTWDKQPDAEALREKIGILTRALDGYYDHFLAVSDITNHPLDRKVLERQKLNGWLSLPQNDISPLNSEQCDRTKKQLESAQEQRTKLWNSPSTAEQQERLYRRSRYLGMTGSEDRRAKIAAMDASLRRMMQATEADLEMQFINPALARIYTSASASGITLSNIERNGVIAINRATARVSPRSTFEIELPQRVDALKETMNAGTLVAALQTGALAPALAGIGKIQPSEVTDMPGTYFVQSGNEIEFTPVVGPDGQSIRMGVHLRRNTPSRLPNRERGQNFGTIEQHTIDTDVEDTNFEIIELARFDTQAEVGETPHREGGLPILREIPGLRNLPLIGYFRKQRSAVVGRQQSLVFLQTSIYPSITDLMGIFDEEGGKVG